MKNKISILLCLLLMATRSHAQEDQIPDGYKLKKSQNFVYAYRNNSDDKPDTTIQNRWNHDYWFKVDSKTYADPNKKKYIRISIISKKRYNDTKGDWVEEKAYGTTVPWVAQGEIDGSDFNTWLWITEKDFNDLKENYYGSVKGRFILTGLTAPFKYRFPEADQRNNVINGDINLGTFIGLRLARKPNFGASIGAHLGLSSFAANASNNTQITDQKAETMAGFTYGGGVVFDVYKKFQLGLILGYDNATGNLGRSYIYQDRPWLSFSLNFKFLDFGDKEESDSNKGNAPKKGK